jgi:pilus assembly protein CpaB
MPKRLPFIVASVVLALIAVFLVNMYLQEQSRNLRLQAKREVTKMQEKLASILVASKDIPKGAAIEADMLETKVVPKEYIQPQAVTYPERITGMMTLVPISKGEQITLSKLASSKQAATTSLAMATPIGKRAISISVDNASSLMGMIRPGDYVDVMGLIPVPIQTAEGKQAVQAAVMPLFQNVQVLAVGRDLATPSTADRRYSKEAETVSSSPLFTLALLPQEASLIAFVQEQGKIRLVLRSPADSRIEPVQPASWETLFQYLMPQLSQGKEQGSVTPEAQIQAAQEKPKEIEIYRGLKKETLTLSKSKPE